MKPLFFSLIGLGVATTFLSNSAVAVYSDTGSIPQNQQEAITELTDRELVEGYADGTFRPTQSVNRAEFLKVLVAASEKSMGVNPDIACFRDFTGKAEWYWESACAAKQAGIIHGYEDGTFKGSRYINIAEAMKIAANAFDLPLPMYFREPDNWYDPYMDVMSGKAVFEGVRREPGNLMTRAEMAFVVMKLTASSQPQCDGRELGESYKIDCNTCICTESGPACTKMACPAKTKCTSSNDCSGTQRCSTERGDCQSLCDDPNAMCPAVCAGFCE